jgi:hypothetical protein
MKLINKIMAYTMVGLSYIGLPAQASADFLEGIQTKKPGQVEFIGAKTSNDSLEKIVALTNLKIKTDWFYGALSLPYSSATSGDESSAGLGDIAVEVGPHFKLSDWYVLTTGKVKFSTGDYNPEEKLNPGNGKTEVSGSVRVTRTYRSGSLDLGFSYAESLGGKNKAEIRFTPGLNSGNWRFGVESSATLGPKDKLTVGPIARYTKGGFHVTGFAQSVYSENETTGIQYGVRVRLTP